MAEPFKNLFNKEYIDLLSDKLLENYKEFDKENFTKTVLDKNWESKELKERMRHITLSLGEFLPKEYLEAIKILKETYPTIQNYDLALQNMVFQDYVEVYGLDYFDESIKAFEIFTIDSSCEFAVRPFIIKYEKEMMAVMKKWAESNNEHIRRLASEGSRSRLPWAIALPSFKKDPTPMLEILEKLKDDDIEYVRRSVANNLNDISKDNSDLLIEITKKWIGKNTNRDKLLKHGCRTLLKDGNEEIMTLFGFTDPKDITLSDFQILKKVDVGEKIPFSFQISSKKQLGKIRLEYELEMVRQKGKTGKKVFKISEGNYTDKTKKVETFHSFKIVTTRKYYSGTHKITLIINGRKFVTKDFQLIGDSH
ncbi:MAG: DNA alkylation repair protein [Campylobacterales bacterium]|nr:DNA alkylation repair protein [Campylobacterales bacterium]